MQRCGKLPAICCRRPRAWPRLRRPAQGLRHHPSGSAMPPVTNTASAVHENAFAPRMLHENVRQGSGSNSKVIPGRPVVGPYQSPVFGRDHRARRNMQPTGMSTEWRVSDSCCFRAAVAQRRLFVRRGGGVRVRRERRRRKSRCDAAHVARRSLGPRCGTAHHGCAATRLEVAGVRGRA